MIDALSALSLYRQLEGLEEVLKKVEDKGNKPVVCGVYEPVVLQPRSGPNYRAVR